MASNRERTAAISARLADVDRRLPAPSRWAGVLENMSRQGLEILLRLKQGGCRPDAITAEETETLRADIASAIAARDTAARAARHKAAWFKWAYANGIPFRESDGADREPLYLLPAELDPD